MLAIREIYDASHLVREQFETQAYDGDQLAKLYQGYAPDLDVTTFLESATRLFPIGNCGIASLVLQQALGYGTVVYGTYEHDMYGEQDVDGHSFLVLDSADAGPVIADITADQFGGPAIYVGKLVMPWSVQAAAS